MPELTVTTLDSKCSPWMCSLGISQGTARNTESQVPAHTCDQKLHFNKMNSSRVWHCVRYCPCTCMEEQLCAWLDVMELFMQGPWAGGRLVLKEKITYSLPITSMPVSLVLPHSTLHWTCNCFSSILYNHCFCTRYYVLHVISSQIVRCAGITNCLKRMWECLNFSLERQSVGKVHL